LNKNILTTGVQNFINLNSDTDTMSVLLKKPIFNTVSNKELTEQLEARKKCQKKLPTWFESPNIYYPNKRNIEQTSSEITAAYKANLVNGKTLIDLTGGLGVDSFFFSKKIARVFHCEINENLSKIAAHNFKVLEAKNIVVIPIDGISFIISQNQHFDWLYIDPSRRNEAKGKVFRLTDCTPDVSVQLDLFFEKANNTLIKTSPLLDISKGISELNNVAEIHIIAVANEVKELLWVLESGFLGETEVKTFNISKKSQQEFNFYLSVEKNTISTFSKPLAYLYEPNAAIMKSGGFKIIGRKFDLQKLHANTHLYTSAQLIDFPGRCFRIIETYPFNNKAIKNTGIKKANISARNFPISVADIRKKLKIKDGGETFLFFITDNNEKLRVLRCERF